MACWVDGGTLLPESESSDLNHDTEQAKAAHQDGKDNHYILEYVDFFEFLPVIIMLLILIVTDVLF